MASLQDLPEELLLKIFSHIETPSSFSDINNVQFVSKSFYSLCNSDEFLRQVSFRTIPLLPWFRNINKYVNFLGRCCQNGNRDAMYHKGFIYCFTRYGYDLNEGLYYLQQAAEKGNEDAIYIVGVMLICFGGEAKYKGFKMLCSLVHPSMKTTMQTMEKFRGKILTTILWHQPEMFDLLKESYVREVCNCGGQTEVFLNIDHGWNPYAGDMLLSSACEVCFWHWEIQHYFDLLQ